MIASRLAAHRKVTKEADDATPNLSASQALSSIRGYLPGVTPGLVFFIVFGTTRAFRETMWTTIAGRHHYMKRKQPVTDYESQLSSIKLSTHLSPFQNGEMPTPIKTVPPSRQSIYTPITTKLSVRSAQASPRITSPLNPVYAARTTYLPQKVRPRSKSTGTVTNENHYTLGPTSPQAPNRGRRSQSIGDTDRYLPNFSRKYFVETTNLPTDVTMKRGCYDTGNPTSLKANNADEGTGLKTPGLPTLKSRFNKN